VLSSGSSPYDDRVSSPVDAPSELTPAVPAPTREETEQALLSKLLGPAALRLGATRESRLRGWLWPLAVTVLAGVLRFANLGRPPKLVFDETYYVKQAYTLLKVGYESRWPDDPNPAFEAGHLGGYLTAPDFFVHPQLGKWLIALGLKLGGPENSASWRLSAAIFGTLAVLMIARIARRLFSSNLMGATAGLLLAIDGEAIVQSRTGLLDSFLMFFVLAAFGALLIDRDQARRRLAHRASLQHGRHGELSEWGPGLGARWWRIAAAVLLGLAIGTKWSGMYFLAVFGVMSVLWDLSARRTLGVRRWALAGTVRDGLPALAMMVPVALVTYLGTWFSWFTHRASYDRLWAEQNPGQGVQWLPAPLRSLWHFHNEMWVFHNGLESPHSYAASPLGWIVQWRPTSFYWEAPTPPQQACGSNSCAAAITSLGNPIIWWAAAIAMIWVIGRMAVRRDWRAAAVLSGVAAGWLPWFAYTHRTIFTFYAIVFTPWVILTLTYALAHLVDDDEGAIRLRRPRARVAIGVVGLAVVVSAFFYPIWTAQTTSYDFWHIHMWLGSWI